MAVPELIRCRAVSGHSLLSKIPYFFEVNNQWLILFVSLSRMVKNRQVVNNAKIVNHEERR
jgi:hypothetical protein